MYLLFTPAVLELNMQHMCKPLRLMIIQNYTVLPTHYQSGTTRLDTKLLPYQSSKNFLMERKTVIRVLFKLHS